MRRETERMFSEQFKNVENQIPQDVIKEYDIPEGRKEVVPIVYCYYSMIIGPD